MTKEDIIATAIHEAFLCGKEAGEESQRMYTKMQNEIDYAAEEANPLPIGNNYYKILAEENKKLGKIIEEKDATIIELRAQIDEKQKEIRALDDDHTKLLRLIKEKDATIAELRALNDKLYASINPLAIIKPQGEEVPEDPSPCTNFNEGDQVIVSGAYFGDTVPDQHGVIMEAKKYIARVLMTEKDSDYEDDEYGVPYDDLKMI